MFVLHHFLMPVCCCWSCASAIWMKPMFIWLDLTEPTDQHVQPMNISLCRINTSLCFLILSLTKRHLSWRKTNVVKHITENYVNVWLSYMLLSYISVMWYAILKITLFFRWSLLCVSTNMLISAGLCTKFNTFCLFKINVEMTHGWLIFQRKLQVNVFDGSTSQNWARMFASVLCNRMTVFGKVLICFHQWSCKQVYFYFQRKSLLL